MKTRDKGQMASAGQDGGVSLHRAPAVNEPSRGHQVELLVVKGHKHVQDTKVLADDARRFQ